MNQKKSLQERKKVTNSSNAGGREASQEAILWKSIVTIDFVSWSRNRLLSSATPKAFPPASLSFSFFLFLSLSFFFSLSLSFCQRKVSAPDVFN